MDHFCECNYSHAPHNDVSVNDGPMERIYDGGLIRL